MFGGAFVVDNYSLALTAFFVIAAYVTLLLSVDYINEGDYYKGEFYFLLLVSTFGMSIMASARDLITLFVALETISIPTFVLAAYRKHDRASNEAGVKYYLIGVLSSALMLYGMSLIFGVTGTHAAVADISDYFGARRRRRSSRSRSSCRSSGSRSRSARCRSTSGRPTPTRARRRRSPRSCRSRRRRAGSSRCINIIYFGFLLPTGACRYVVAGALDPRGASMTLGNLAALRQTNIVRMLAYSSVAQGGFMLVPFAAAGIAGADGDPKVAAAMSAVLVYLLIYGAMNLGAFAVVIAVARRTRTRRDLVVRRPVPNVARPRGDDDVLPRVARRRPAARGLVRQVRDVPRRSSTRARGWAIALAVIAARELGDRVLLLLPRRSVQMWFHEPATETARRSRSRSRSASRWADRARSSSSSASTRRSSRGSGRSRSESASGERERIARADPARRPDHVRRFMEAALYGEGGFFASGQGAGRAGRDFVTSPEVGSLFGACVARALDRMWHALGAPDPFLVVEAGAGNGRLARRRIARRRRSALARAALRARRAVAGVARRAA